MKKMRALLPFIAVPFVAGCATTSGFPDGAWVDLTYDLSSETIYWPTAEPFKLEAVSKGMTEAGYYYSAYTFCAAEHGGTHIDAPVHFAEGRKSVDELPLSRLIGPAVKIDVSAKALANRDYLITVDDIREWETRHGAIPDGSIVLLETGYGRYWPNASQYLGTALRGPEGVAALHFPGLHPDAAAWLVNKHRVNAIGIDTASIDYGQSKTFDTHVTLTANDTPVFENVAHLDRVPARGAYIVALPIKIKGGSGSPLRIAALLPN